MFQRKRLYLFYLLVLGCNRNDPQSIVDKSIGAHGGRRFENLRIEFDFRDRHYTSIMNEGKFTYTREFSDSSNNRIRDVLTNDGFHREVNGNIADIPEERARAYTNSVNSVLYFALLPFRLNDPAVVKNYRGQTTINNKDYHIIKITFQEEGGGKDFEDEFLFWINKDNYRVDYFAYSYASDGGGVRFREAISGREINGILLQDYNNYKPTSDTVVLDQMEELFKANKLEKMSVINMENVIVEY